MERSKKRLLCWTLVLIMLFSVFLPAKIAYAAEDKTSVLTNFTASIKQNGTEVTEGGTLASTDPITVELSFGVPVSGDEPTPQNPVKKGDTATFQVSNAFTLLSGTHTIPLNYSGTLVGNATFTADPITKMVFANVVFDGADEVFDGSTGLNNVTCRFNADLQYDKDGAAGEVGDHDVTILGKTFTVNVPPAETVYEVTKLGTPNLADRRIEWEVNLTATQGGNPIDLNGYQFVDDLSAVGSYIPGTFAVNTASSLAPDYNSNILSYTFPAGSTSPQSISFATEIPENKYYGSGNQSITNNAQLKDSTNELKKEGTKTVTFAPPKWIEKTGQASDAGGGTYIPTGRTITWTITANHEGATLNNVVITDALPSGLTLNSAKWEKWDSNSSAWVDETTITPSGNDYTIGNISSKIRLILVTNVPDASHTTGTTRYTNSATIRWDGSPGSGSGLTSGNISIDIGYSAITKTGTPDPKNRTINWRVTVDARGQSSLTNLKVYDLLVYGSNTSGFDKTTVSWPAGITAGDITNIRYDQKYIPGSFNNEGPSSIGLPTVHPIMQGGVRVADLLEFTGLSNTQVNAFTFDTLVVNPDIFASNTTNSRRVYNTAMLFSDTTKLAEATADPIYNSSVLRKEMLRRDAMGNPAAGVNNVTTTASEGFHYIDKSAIFRLSVNADGIDWTNIQNGAGEALGMVTITDTLPTGWEFTKFAGGEDFLIFEGTKNGSSINATDTTPDTVSGLTPNFSGGTATFTFDPLDQPYVILVKAKPTTDTVAGYFNKNQDTTVTNNLTLRADNWTPGVSVSRNVAIKSELLSKNSQLPENGVLRWTVEYKPYDVSHTGTRRIEDTLPLGLDLRTNASGALLLDGNITAHEMTLNADGSYTQGDAITLVLGGNISYNNQTRALSFIIPENNKAYRLNYITDITGEPGTVTNSVRLVAGGSSVEGKAVPYSIRALDGSASMQRNGWLEITKTDGSGALLAGAEFTLFAMDGTTIIRQGTSDINGKVRLKVIPDGEYLLKETVPPTGGYTLEGVSHSVAVETEGTTITTSIDGKTGTGSNLLTVKNYLIGTAGSLTIRKNVAGNAAEIGREFEFTVSLSDTVNTYMYTGANGGPSGSMTGSAAIMLGDGQSVTITGLPQGLTYDVAEKDYSGDGYVTVKTGDAGAIVADVTSEAVFTNTRNAPGTLTISKTVTGNAAEEGMKFEFTVTLSDTVNTYTYTGANGGPSGTIKGSAIIELAGGQSVSIAGLREGLTYQVTEKDYSSEGYSTVKTGDGGKIETNGTYVAAFTNTKEHVSPGVSTGNLTIGKKVAGNGASATKKFEFMVSFNAAGTYSYTGHGVPNGTIESGGRISLAHGQSITVKGLPKGTTYTVTEEDYTADGYSATSTGDAGMISGGITKKVEFTNTRRAVTPGALMIQKIVIGDDYSKKEAFTFVVTLDTSGWYQYSGSKTGTIASGEAITLSHGEYIEILGLPTGTSYRVTEREANQDGFFTSSTGASGKISASGNTAAFVNTRISVPKTGDSGTIRIIGMIIFAMLLISGSVLLIRAKRSFTDRY